jgi:hypothetical protein
MIAVLTGSTLAVAQVFVVLGQAGMVAFVAYMVTRSSK